MLIEDPNKRADSKYLIESQKKYLELNSRLFQGFNNKFVGRKIIINDIESILTQKQGVLLTAYGGCGKSRLANEIGNIFLNKNYIVRLLNSETKEKLINDYYQVFEGIFDIQNYDLNKYTFNVIIQKIKYKIEQFDSK